MICKASEFFLNGKLLPLIEDVEITIDPAQPGSEFTNVIFQLDNLVRGLPDKALKAMAKAISIEAEKRGIA